MVSREVVTPHVSGMTTKHLNMAIKCNCVQVLILQLSVSLEQHNWLELASCFSPPQHESWTPPVKLFCLVLSTCPEYVNCFIAPQAYMAA